MPHELCGSVSPRSPIFLISNCLRSRSSIWVCPRAPWPLPMHCRPSAYVSIIILGVESYQAMEVSRRFRALSTPTELPSCSSQGNQRTPWPATQCGCYERQLSTAPTHPQTALTGRRPHLSRKPRQRTPRRSWLCSVWLMRNSIDVVSVQQPLHEATPWDIPEMSCPKAVHSVLANLPRPVLYI